MEKVPLYLKGYGSYGEPYTQLNSNSLAWFDPAVVCASRHSRGRGRNGQSLSTDGLMMLENTFHLLHRLCRISLRLGRKNGSKDAAGNEGRTPAALLMGAVLICAPDLFQHHGRWWCSIRRRQ